MRPVPRSRHTAVPDHASAQRGQSLVEFSLVMMPLFIILLGIIQFGFIFNAYVTITNASREGARIGTVFVCNEDSIGTPTWSKPTCDFYRNNAIKDTLMGSMNLLSTSAPHFATSGTWTQSGLTFTDGDLVITYSNPAMVLETDARIGQQITVRATYHQDLIIPLIAQLLPRDANGRLGLTSETTMVVN